MKPSRFTEEQIIGILREQEAGTKSGGQQRNALQMEGQVLKMLLLKRGGPVSVRGNAWLYWWAGSEAARVIVADGRSVGARCDQVSQPSTGRCGSAGTAARAGVRSPAVRLSPPTVDRSTYHYRCRRAGQAELTERIKEIAAPRVRYGYRRIHVLLRREGWPVNAKRVYRLYRELGLQLRNKTPKRRGCPSTTPDENARLGVGTTMRSDHTARSATKCQSSWLIGQRHAAYPDQSAPEKGRQPGPRMASGSNQSRILLIAG
jgi:hypothetical protein